MNFAKKLREVVASNFIEIAKTEENDASPRRTPDIDRVSPPAYMDAPPPPPVVPPVVPVTSESGTIAPDNDTDHPANEVAAETTTVPETVVAEPVPVSVEPPVSAPARRNLLALVAPHEPVDLERILQEARLPQVPFSAEQAAKVLAALPADLPLQVKRITVKATMEAVERTRAIEPQELVADAMLKKAHLSDYREEFHGHVEALHQETDLEIERLQAEIERLRQLKASFDRKKRALNQAADERIAQMEQVIVFFQSEVAQELEQAKPLTVDDDEELPPFMRDDSVMKMLGMETAAAAPEGANNEEERRPLASAGSTAH
ncbi:MAG: hypothetical protein SFU56_06435 [Capsulimonadales bacterium]|nr:hypothetical protein [Capsulimonadales bacterium]